MESKALDYNTSDLTPPAASTLELPLQTAMRTVATRYIRRVQGKWMYLAACLFAKLQSMSRAFVGFALAQPLIKFAT